MLFVTRAASPASATAVTPVQEVPGASLLSAVACSTATTCVAVGYVIAGAAQQFPGPSSQFRAVACSSATTCYAVGTQLVPNPGHRPTTHTIVVPITDGVLGAPQEVSGAELSAITCVSATTCDAVGTSPLGGAVLVPIVNGVPGTPLAVPGIDTVNGVACPTAASCYVTGNNPG